MEEATRVMRFGVLGPVTAHSEHGLVELGPARQRAVLAVLLVEHAAAVSIDQLVERVWGTALPQRARQTLHTYLSRLRRVLAAANGPVLAQRPGGYTLEVDAAAVDLHRFRALAAAARTAPDDVTAASRWQEALSLWRGRPFADVDSEWLHTVAMTIEDERLAARLDATDVLLRQDQPAQLVPELAAAAAEYPLDERVAGQLMLALYRCGRQADALAHYQRLRGRLAEELGSDPGPALRELHQRILRQEANLTPTPTPAPPTATGPAGRRHLAQLPADVAGFTGRAQDLHQLDLALRNLDDASGSHAVVIIAIGGTAGVGKTALAVHWAHRVADQFPAGQLYVNLRGYDPQEPVEPADALARLLTALGVAGQDIPLDLEDRAARYRSELARLASDGSSAASPGASGILIMLDNAASVAQVRPLLPGSGPCVVVVTSRDSLAGLVAVDGAHRLDLDLLTRAEASGLLRRLVGPRTDAEPAAAALLAEQCARLPLALRVAAELAASRPATSLAELTAELADQQARLELLDAGDPRAAVREVFSWSLQQLPGPVARTFRLLGLHPGADLDRHAAAALAGITADQAGRQLDQLTRAHLLHRAGPHRYASHDLLRAYATHLTTTQDSDQDRQAATGRLRDYYLAGAAAAVRTLYGADVRALPHIPPVTGGPDLAEPDAARGWLDAERQCLVAVAVQAATQDRPGYAADLARTLQTYLHGGYPADLLRISGHALAAAERAGDVDQAAQMLGQLGWAYLRLGQQDQATAQFQRAVAACRESGDLAGEARALTSLGTVAFRQGEHKRAIDNHTRAIALARQAGDRITQAAGSTNLANVETRMGRYDAAAEQLQQALAIMRELGSKHNITIVLNNLGLNELRLGKYDAAAAHLHEALAVVAQLDSPISEAEVLDTLGEVHLRLAEPEPATDCFQRALDRYRQAGERPGQAATINGLGEAAQLAGRPALARTHHTEALAIAAELNARDQCARAHAGLGHAHRTMGDPDRARIHYEQAYAIYAELNMPEADQVSADLARLASSVPAGSRP